MAEDVVLARLKVDSKGVTKGVNEAGDALAQGADDVQEFGDKTEQASGSSKSFAGSIFDLQGALTGFAGAIGLVAVASILATVTRELVTNSEAWKASTIAIRDFFGELVLGEGVAEKVSRGLERSRERASVVVPELILKQRIKTVFDEIEVQKKLRDELLKSRDAQEATGFLIGETTQRIQEINTAHGTFFIKSTKTNKAISTFNREIEDANISITAMQKNFSDLQIEIANVRGANVNVTSSIVELQDKLEKTKIATIAYLEPIGDLKVGFAELDNPFKLFDEHLDNQIKKWEALNEEVRKYSIKLRNLLQIMGPVKEATDEIVEATKLQVVAFRAAESAAASAGAGIANAFFEGGQTFSEVISGMLKDLARFLIIESLMWVARAIIAATSPAGAAIYGPAGPLLTGAAKLAAAAALAGVAAKAIGGGGGGEAQGPGAPFAPAVGGGQSFNVTVIVQGSLLGQTEDQLGRDIITLIRKAASDNA